jgi:XTP/dITP diphosphohydrolase
MTRLLLATRNTKKLAELQRILDGALGAGVISLIGLADVPPYAEVPESGLTFVDNALLKAREGAAHTGLPTVADDSGLAVDVLNGMPGVFSARWSGRHGDDAANLELLLSQISDVDDAHRGARFVCAAALVLPGARDARSSATVVAGAARTEFTVTGEMVGRLIREPRGSGGFGYDPIFVATGNTLTNAELSPETKDAISHRGKAFRALADIILVQLT